MALDRSRNDSHMDDDDKLLDVVGPSQSPLLPLSHSLQQLQSHPHSGTLTSCWLCVHSCLFSVCEFHILIEIVLYIAWFAAWFNLTGGEGQGSGPDPEALRRRLQGNGSEDPDGRDGSDSNCSDNMSGTTTGGGGGGSSGGAFRPTTSTGGMRNFQKLKIIL